MALGVGTGVGAALAPFTFGASIPIGAAVDVASTGALIGAGVGAGTAAMDANEQKKGAAAAAGSRPKRRKLAAMLEQLRDAQNRRLAGMGMLSQASFDWASALR
jgi:hypothetical protein